jgi:hypothetical protein
MRKRAHANVIMEAFANRLPENEAWYHERLRICGACEHNTKNMGADGMREKLRLALIDGIHLGQDSCFLCGCFIRQKCAAEEVACSLEESGRAKWHRRKILTSKADDFNLFNEASEKCNIDIDPEKNQFVVRYNPVEKGEPIDSSFVLHHDTGKHIEIEEVKASCGCVSIKHRMLSDSEYRLDLRVDTSSFSLDRETSRSIIVAYRRDGEVCFLKMELIFIIRRGEAEILKAGETLSVEASTETIISTRSKIEAGTTKGSETTIIFL